MPDLQVTFLEAGQQSAAQVAAQIAGFLAQATQSIDLAIYDLHLTGAARATLLGALAERQRAGVQIRIAYDSGDKTANPALPATQGALPSTSQTASFLANTGLPSKAIASEMNLMHHKYFILDRGTAQAQVLMGSSNFTDASWSLQENNILTIPSPELATFYAQDFEELWITSDIQTTGLHDTGQAMLSYAGQPAPATVFFAPGQGQRIDAEVAHRLGQAQREITLAVVVLTSGHILGALHDLMQEGLPIDGIYDRTQMAGVFVQWQQVPQNGWKIPAFGDIVQYGHLAGKNSAPWTATSVHDFMHNKVIVVDDTVMTGSFNFSRNAQGNAENILMIESAALAAAYRAYIRHLVARYGPAA